MRLALLSTTDIGTRCGRALLGEGSLEALGLIGKRPTGGDERIVETGRDLSGWDVLVSDDPAAGIRLARRSGLPLAIPSPDPDARHRLSGLRSPVLASCDASGLGGALLAQVTANAGELLEGVVAWTVPGSLLRAGDPVSFPDPVGPRWSRPLVPLPAWAETGTRVLIAPGDPDWLGVVARVALATTDGVVSRTLGVADHPAYLEAIALAAGALTLATIPTTLGTRHPGDVAGVYLEKAMELGLGVASLTERQAVRREG